MSWAMEACIGLGEISTMARFDFHDSIQLTRVRNSLVRVSRLACAVGA